LETRPFMNTVLLISPASEIYSRITPKNNQTPLKSKQPCHTSETFNPRPNSFKQANLFLTSHFQIQSKIRQQLPYSLLKSIPSNPNQFQKNKFKKPLIFKYFRKIQGGFFFMVSSYIQKTFSKSNSLYNYITYKKPNPISENSVRKSDNLSTLIITLIITTNNLRFTNCKLLSETQAVNPSI
jgi:hypothetical protein